MSDLISQRELARRMQCNPSYVTKLKATGRLVMRGGKVDYDATVGLIESTKDPAKAYMGRVNDKQRRQPRHVAEDIPNATFQRARTAKQVFDAKIRETNYKALIGEYLKAADVRFAYASKLSGARDLLLSLPDRTAAMLAAENDMRKVHAILLKEIKQAMRLLTAEPSPEQ